MSLINCTRWTNGEVSEVNKYSSVHTCEIRYLAARVASFDYRTNSFARYAFFDESVEIKRNLSLIFDKYVIR